MSLGMGFEYQGFPPVPIITVIEPGGAAEQAGVRIGDIIVQIDSVTVNPTVDVRNLLVNNNPEVRLVLQPSSGLFGIMGITSFSSRGQTRSVTISRRRAGGGSNSTSSHRSPNVDETLLPPKAQAARETGRTRFRESRWAEAAEAFSDAIEASGVGSHTLYTNRALCYQKLQRWPDVERDARAAMSCSGGGGSSVKAHYLLGKALLEQDKLEAAKEALLKSMSLSSSPDFKSYRGSIDAALFLAQKKIWQRQQESKDREDEALRESLLRLADACYSRQEEQEEGKGEEGGEGGEGQSAAHKHRERMNAISQFVSRSRVKRKISEIPSGIMCKLTHRIMLDPVTTPFGQTYEREALEKHMKEVRGDRDFDSLCADPLKASERYSATQLVPNLSLRRYIDEFLEVHPWAYDEETVETQ